MRATPSESSRRTRGTYSLVRSRRRRPSSLLLLLFSSQTTTTTTKPLPTGKRPPPSEVPLLRCARALKRAQKHREREKQKREKQRERRRRFVGLGFSRASLCVCAYAPLKAFNASCNCHNVTWSFPLAPRADIFWFPRLINQSVTAFVRAR